MGKKIKYDLKKGVLHAWWKYLLFALLIMLVCMIERKEAKFGVEWGIYTRPSLGNYFLKWFQGMPPVTGEEKMRQINIPMEWVLLQMTYVLFITHYISSDLTQNGYRLFLQYGRKTTWWNGKCIWLLATTLCYYIVFYLTVGIMSGSLSLEPASEIWRNGLRYEGNLVCVGMTFVLPVLSSLAIGGIGMLLEMAFSPLIAIFCDFGILLASVFWCSPLLLGNHTMFVRNSYCTAGTGVNTLECMAVCISCSVIVYIAGKIYLNKHEMAGGI